MTDLESICYDKLREIGVSVETADSLAPILASLTPKKRRAFMLWAMGMTMRDVGKLCGRSLWWVQCIVSQVKKSTNACKNR
jgi:DNA-directed RNA polymerase specialized sigma24 family protein